MDQAWGAGRWEHPGSIARAEPQVVAPGLRRSGCWVQTEGGLGEMDSHPGGGEERAASGW